MTLGNKIAELRKEKGMTQEALANELGVSNQAVSKWEANQSCPDIQLLPQIADLFNVTIDSLFGRETGNGGQGNVVITIDNVNAEELPDNVVITKEVVKKEMQAMYDLPWEDDGVLRAVIYIGQKLVMAQDCSDENEIIFEYNGAALNIESSFSVNCGDVMGNVSAGGDVECDDVAGHVTAGGDVTCDSVEGNIEAGGDVTSDEVEGSVTAGGDVTCDEVAGNVIANGDVTCDEVAGNVTVKGDISCDHIEGYVVKS